MVQIEQNNDKSNITKPNYSPEDDPEVQDDIEDKLNYIRDKFDPYQRYIMVIGIIILITLVVFLGVAYGGLRICRDLDGLLDNKFKCHPNYSPEIIYSERASIVSLIPNLSEGLEWKQTT